MRVGGQGHAPAALPPGKTRYPLYRRLGGPQGRCGRARKISPLPGFDPPIVQPVASCYTEWAIPALICIYTHIYILVLQSGYLELEVRKEQKDGENAMRRIIWGRCEDGTQRKDRMNKKCIQKKLSEDLKRRTEQGKDLRTDGQDN